MVMAKIGVEKKSHFEGNMVIDLDILFMERAPLMKPLFNSSKVVITE